MRDGITRWGWRLALGLLLLAGSPARAAVELPGGTTVEQVDFERHVMGVLGRMGCASGSCHGSFQGKGNFRLSLFGYDPAKDHYALFRDGNGRRIDLADPDQSLLLLKATGQSAHGGQTRFGKSSWQYQLLRAWIAQGAKWTPGSGQVKSVAISPPEYAFRKAGTVGRLKVVATFDDDSLADITSLCDYRTNDDAVAEVSSLGVVKALRPGDTSIVVSYRGTVLPVRVLVPVEPKPGFVYPKIPEVNYVDRDVFAKLRRLNMVPSELSGDTEFLRRVTLDTIGSQPTPDEVKAFLADDSADKREKKIDELLAHPLHAALWATKFSDITGNNTDTLENPQQRRPYQSQMWHDWLRKRVADNMPYDELVKGILTATSRDGASFEDYIKQIADIEEAQDKGEKTKYADRATLDLFWRKQGRPTNEEWGEKTAAAFLGVRLECAQCHKHPFDRWTQSDYRAFGNIFRTVNLAVPPKDAKEYLVVNKERAERMKQAQAMAKDKGKKVIGLPIAPIREVFVGAPNKAVGLDPDTGKPLVPRTLGGSELATRAGTDIRLDLWKWMREEDNPFFARSFVNRVWGHYMGVGIVHPVDDFSLANPPSNEKLLASLAADFVKNKYDIRAIEKTILMSRTYQLSSKANETNRLDKNCYARAYVRPLMAEVVVDLLNTALGTSEKWAAGEAPSGSRAIEVGASRVQNPSVNYDFRVFGRPPRSSACDCERAMDPALPQKLFLIADPILAQKLAAPNRLSTLLASKKTDLEILDELVLATVSRYPTEAEKKAFVEYRDTKIGDPSKAAPPAAIQPEKPAKGKPPVKPAKVQPVVKPVKGQPAIKGQPVAVQSARRDVFVDTLWALINTREFIFNH